LKDQTFAVFYIALIRASMRLI